MLGCGLSSTCVLTVPMVGGNYIIVLLWYQVHSGFSRNLRMSRLVEKYRLPLAYQN
jgi:hypothetical protein